MSTRATITVADTRDSFDLYQHHDGYPEGPCGLVGHIALAQRLAWELPRFEAADFAAAVIAVLKDRGGSTYLTKEADAHSDRAYHYRIEPIREDTLTRIQLTILRPHWDSARRKHDVEMFKGSIPEAVKTFKAAPETTGQPREWQILSDLEGALYRAEDEIGQLCGHRPDDDTADTLNDIDDAGRAACLLRHHLENNDPWHTLARVEACLNRLRQTGDSIQPNALPHVDVRLVMDAHRRFQRE